jgi:hypothetical protein
MSSFSGSLNLTADRPATILDEAAKAVDGERQHVYGHPGEDFKRIAEYWTIHLGDRLKSPIRPEDVGFMQMMVKLSRLYHSPNHRDSLIDIAGYARCNEKVQEYYATKIQPVPVDIYR